MWHTREHKLEAFELGSDLAAHEHLVAHANHASAGGLARPIERSHNAVRAGTIDTCVPSLRHLCAERGCCIEVGLWRLLRAAAVHADVQRHEACRCKV